MIHTKIKKAAFIKLLSISLFIISLFANTSSINAEEKKALQSTAHSRLTGSIKTIIVDNYQPYTFINDRGEPDGFSVEIAKAVASAVDLKLQIRPGKWDFAMKELEDGGIDLLPMMAYSRERDKTYDFSVPHTIAYDAFFIKKGGSFISSINDLLGKTVIVLNRDIVHSRLTKNGFSNNVKLLLVDSLPEAFKQLSEGNGDVAIMPKLVGIVTLKKLGIKDIESTNIIDDYSRPFSFAVKNGNQELLERLNQGLNIIKSSGQYDEIYKKWFGLIEDPHLYWKLVFKILIATTIILIVVTIWNTLLRRKVKAKTLHLKKEIEMRERSEENIRLITQRLELATNSAKLGVWDWDIANNIMVWDDRMLELYGITRHKFPGGIAAWHNGLHPEDRDNTIAECEAALRGEKEWDTVFRVMHPDGTVKHIKANGTVIRDSEGKPLRMLGINADITDFVKAEEALKLNEDRLETLLKLSMMKFNSEKEITEFALEEAVRLTSSKGGYLHFFDEDEQTIQLYSWSREVLKLCTAGSNEHYPLDKAGVWADSIRLRKTVIHNNYQKLTNKKGYPEGHFHLVRHLGVPVFDGGKIVVVMGLGNKEEPYNEIDAIQASLFMSSMWKILKQKKTENERDKLITELQDSIANVKTLQGILPICSYCKKIRNDKGYWDQLDSYIALHTDAQFSHGACPECSEKAMNEFKNIFNNRGSDH